MANRRDRVFRPDIVPVYVRSPKPITALRLLEDRRVFHPDAELRAPRSFFTRPRLVISPAKQPTRNGAHRLRSLFPSFKVGFQVPGIVARCIRRKTRKEVIHAKKLQGKGARGKKHFDFWSGIKC